MPEVAERILASGQADMVSMARPLLADPEWGNKASAGHSERINTCIASNQACLDHVFENRKAHCLVHPRACADTQPHFTPTPQRQRPNRQTDRWGRRDADRLVSGGCRILEKKKRA